MPDRGWVLEAVRRHEGPLLAYVQRLTGDAEASRDIVQDAFVQLCKQPASLNGRVGPWLYSVCRNRAIDVARKENRMTALADMEMAAKEPNPAQAAETKEAAAAVMKSLETLPALQQEAVRLKFQQQFAYKEIAEVMGLSISHVGVLLHEALKTLRLSMSV